MHSDSYDIQDLIQASGVPRRTIHFYVQQGILPPPDGAGLAARYSEEHLTRLRLIPIYRQQGLRLDDIRARFSKMDSDALRQAWQEAAPQAAPIVAAYPEEIKKYRPSVVNPMPAVPRIIREQFAMPDEAGGLSEERFTQFVLPAGIRLLVPEALTNTNRQRVRMLIQAARQIFSGVGGGFYASSDPSTTEQPDTEEE